MVSHTVQVPIFADFEIVQHFIDKKDFESALIHSTICLKKYDRDEAFLNQHGIILKERGQYIRAINFFREAVSKVPASERNRAFPALGNIGTCLRKMYKSSQALPYLGESFYLSHDLRAGAAYVGCLLDLGKLAQAELVCRQIIRAYPNAWEPHVQLANALLLMGNWPEACKEWRWRLQAGNWGVTYESFRCPKWNPRALATLSGQTAIVWTEQGAGEEILMASMLKRLIANEKPKKVYLLCSNRTFDIFKESFLAWPVQVMLRRPGSAPDDATVQLSFAEVLEYTMASDPVRDGQFLSPVNLEEAVAFQTAMRSDQRRPVVGISWFSTNPDYGDVKSMDLHEFKPILETGAKIVSLQFGDNDRIKADIDRVDKNIHHGNTRDSLSELLKRAWACDLIVTVSNTTAHVAGGMGIKTEVFAPEGQALYWYWNHKTTDDRSNFYHSVHLRKNYRTRPDLNKQGMEEVSREIMKSWR